MPSSHLFHFNQLYNNISRAAVILQNFSVWAEMSPPTEVTGWETLTDGSRERLVYAPRLCFTDLQINITPKNKLLTCLAPTSLSATPLPPSAYISCFSSTILSHRHSFCRFMMTGRICWGQKLPNVFFFRNNKRAFTIFTITWLSMKIMFVSCVYCKAN